MAFGVLAYRMQKSCCFSVSSEFFRTLSTSSSSVLELSCFFLLQRCVLGDFFFNVALSLFSHLYLFFQLRTVPSGTSRSWAISINFLPDKNKSRACSALASGALGNYHHLVLCLFWEKEKRWPEPSLVS